MDLKPIQRVKVSEAIVERIQKLIVEGQLKRGDRLPSERELAERLQVGRTSVREALGILASLGLVTRTCQGTFVGSDDQALLSHPIRSKLILRRRTLEEFVEARGVLEVSIAGLAAERATEEDVAKMREAIKRSKESTGEELMEAEVEFHSALADAAHNNVLADVFQTIRDLMWQVEIEVIQEPGVVVRTQRDHEAIVEAIVARDPALARRRMTRHIALAREILMQHLESEIDST